MPSGWSVNPFVPPPGVFEKQEFLKPIFERFEVAKKYSMLPDDDVASVYFLVIWDRFPAFSPWCDGNTGL